MLVFVLNQAQKANTGKIQTPVYENVREFGLNRTADAYQASTFKHRQKEIWEPGNVQSSGLDRSLREYDRFIEENSHGRC